MPKISRPTVSSRFAIRSLLGQGGFGEVFLAFDDEVGDACALKVIRDELAVHPDYQEAFRKEALTWLHLGKHANIVAAKAVDLFNGRLFIALEFIPPDENGINSLEKALTRRRAGLEQVLRWAIELCWGMSFAYSRGLIAHRDLKPANVLIDQHGRVKISDFGLASHVTIQSGGAKVVSGTPAYMAPEQFIGSSKCDERSDIYSFGIILYQLVTGGCLPFEPPRAAPGDLFAFFQKLHNTFEVPNVRSELNAVVKRCLAKNPAGRFSSFKQIEEALQLLSADIAGQRYSPPRQEELNAVDYNNRAVSFHLLGQKDQAACCLDMAIDSMPDFSLAINNKAAFLADSGLLTEAIELWQRLTQENPRLGRPFFNLANVSLARGDLLQAARFYKHAMNNEPDYVPAVVNAAICQQKQGNFDAAFGLYKKATQIAPNDAQVFYNFGVLLAENGRFQAAVAPLERAVSLNPRLASAHNYLGLCNASLGLRSAAARCYNAALSIEPTHPHAIKNKVLLKQNRDGFWKRLFG